jgi:RNA polymerase sigma-70 factor (ECF subfamily)
MEAERRHRFEDLYATHAPALLAYALRRAGYEAAQDAVAEAFVVVWRRLDDAPAEPSRTSDARFGGGCCCNGS